VLSHKPEIGLVDECGRLQRVVWALSAEVRACTAPQLSVYERQQLIARLKVTALPRSEKSRHRVAGISHLDERPKSTPVLDRGVWIGRNEMLRIQRTPDTETAAIGVERFVVLLATG
jgi:hypothetical protein